MVVVVVEKGIRNNLKLIPLVKHEWGLARTQAASLSATQVNCINASSQKVDINAVNNHTKCIVMHNNVDFK